MYCKNIFIVKKVKWRNVVGVGIGRFLANKYYRVRVISENHTAKNQYWKFETNIPRKENCAATIPISTCMCLWAIFIFPPSICLFCCRIYVDRSWEYINRSQTHECVNWDWGHAIPIRKEFINVIFVAVHAVFKEGVVLPVLQGIRFHVPHDQCSEPVFYN
jgi:hypothetical protein